MKKIAEAPFLHAWREGWAVTDPAKSGECGERRTRNMRISPFQIESNLGKENY